MKAEKKILELTVDRVEEGIAVCLLPEGEAVNVPLPKDAPTGIGDGSRIRVIFEDGVPALAELCAEDEASAAAKEARRRRLRSLFGD